MIPFCFFFLSLSLSSANNINEDTGQWKLFVNERFLALEQKVDVLQQQLKDAFRENIRLTNDNSVLRHKIKTLEIRIENLANQNTEKLKYKQRKLRELERRIDRLTKVNYHYLENQGTEGNSYEIQRKSRIQNERTARLLAPLTYSRPIDVIAFYCHMKSDISAVQSNHLLKFDVVPTNKGNGYNKDDGIFTVPKSGVYVFSWTVAIHAHSCAFSEIVVNGIILGNVTPDSNQNDEYNIATGIVVVEAGAGQHVFIRLSRTCNGQIMSNSDSRTSFAGWLL